MTAPEADSYLPGALPPAGDHQGSACGRFHPALPERQQSGSEQPKEGENG
jgi:hypothetical protein